MAYNFNKQTPKITIDDACKKLREIYGNKRNWKMKAAEGVGITYSHLTKVICGQAQFTTKLEAKIEAAYLIFKANQPIEGVI